MNWVLLILPIVSAKVKIERIRIIRVRKTPQHVVLPDRSSRVTLTEKGSRAEKKLPTCEQTLFMHFFSLGA
jgi:hypothetical protein